MRLIHESNKKITLNLCRRRQNQRGKGWGHHLHYKKRNPRKEKHVLLPAGDKIFRVPNTYFNKGRRKKKSGGEQHLSYKNTQKNKLVLH